MRVAFPLLLLCFVVSGASALLYETAWSSLLGAVFGTSQLAVAAVLVATMGGLAIGASCAGRWGRSLRRPLLAYAFLEFAIGVAALGVAPAIGFARRLQILVLGVEAFDELPSAMASASFYLCAAVVVLAIPTILMGATLPILAGGVVRREQTLGARVGALYATNTIGAAAGALLSAFVLLPSLGLAGTVWIGVGLNLGVAAGALVLSQRFVGRPDRSQPVPASGARWVLPVIAASGAVAFILEVMWTRLLGQIVGSSVQGFALLLAVFLAGLAIGSALASRRSGDFEAASRTLFVAQVGVGLASLGSFALAPWLLPKAPLPSFWAMFGFAASVLLPSAICLGAAFPCAVRLRAAAAAETISASAQVMVWNTAGTIAGALVAAMVLVPSLRFVGTTKVAAGLAFLLAAVVAWFAESPRSKCALALAAGAATFAVPLSTPWSIVQRSVLGLPGEDKVVFYEVGRAATVILREESASWRLTTDGLPESSIQPRGGWRGAMAGPRWLSMLPLAVRPDTRTMLVIGLGAAQTLQSVPPAVERIDVAEIEAQVVRANRFAADWRRSDPLADPRVFVHVQDARSALTLATNRFDAIVSQPSHPWTAGASHLFTREFFALVRERLSEKGVLVQWLAIPFADRPLLRTTVASLLDVFGHVELYTPGKGGSLFFVASSEPLESPDVGALAHAWRELGVANRDDLIVARLLDTEGARRFAAGAPISTDDRNAFASRGIDVLRHRGRSAFADLLAEQRLPADLNFSYVGRRLVDAASLERASALALEMDDAVPRLSLLGLIALANGRPFEARANCWQALRLARTDPEALLCLYRAHRFELDSGGGSARARVALEALPISRAVLEARDGLVRGEWGTARELDHIFAALPIEDPFYRDSVELRVEWRQAAADVESGRRALELTEDLLALDAGGDMWLRRAETAWQAGEIETANGALREALRVVSRNPALWARARRLSHELGIELPLLE